ncbi:MAG TPA: transposase [Solirubrobacteraceae bacterium]|nr:transposase [Solirubrobacteraceae bacterium]
MARDFVSCERGQLLLMPPSLVEWLPEDHLVWTILGAVDQMDLERFREGYRLGGTGRAPYDPAMLVALLLYAYARGNRSSRQIERACLEDVAYKVIPSMRVPDHSTIAEFRRRHETEIAELFDQVLGLCKEAGLVSVGVIMVDGTKIKANASMDQNRSYSGVVRAILREAEQTDRREDELYGDARGDELPEQLRTAEGRKRALADAKRRIEERTGRAVGGEELEREVEVEPARSVSGRGGRREWFRVARHQLEEHRQREGRAIARGREDRLFEAARRLEQNHRVQLAANEAYEHRRATERDKLGRVLKGNSKPYVPPEAPEGQVNLSDPDSRVMRSKGLPHRQAYNVQTAVTEQQIILAAEISLEAADFGQLEPILDRALAHLSRHGIDEQPEAVVGDAGYWHTRQIEAITARGIEVLVPPDGAAREGKRPGWENGLYEQMRDKLKTERGRALYALRKITIEPVFGQIKYNRRVDQFMRRGRAAAHSEIRLVAATHNILKLHNHWIANTA